MQIRGERTTTQYGLSTHDISMMRIGTKRPDTQGYAQGLRQPIRRTIPYFPSTLNVESETSVPVAIAKRVLRKEHQTDALQTDITKARDVYVSSKEAKAQEVVAYDIGQDMAVYNILLQKKDRLDYKETKHNLDRYTTTQVETFLGERMHVGISEFIYHNVDGELQTEATKESALEMYKRGKEYRRKHGEPVDWAREDAEVIGFSRIQEIMTDEKTPVGAMMLFVSPPGDKENGSIYTQNFYEVHQKMSDGTIVAKRFTSGLKPKEAQSRLAELDPRYQRETIPTDAEFIANPVFLSPGEKSFFDAEEVHAFMHKDHESMSDQQFALIRMACRDLIETYVKDLSENPNAAALHDRNMTILLNYADKVADSLNQFKGELPSADAIWSEAVKKWYPPNFDHDALAEQEIRYEDVGCGSSGKKKKGTSVSEFGQEGAENCGTCGTTARDDHYHCPGCTARYESEKNVAANARTKDCRNSECTFEFGC